MPCSEIGRRTFLSCCRVTLVAVISPPEKRQDGLIVQRIARGKIKKIFKNEAKIVGRSLCGRPLTEFLPRNYNCSPSRWDVHIGACQLGGHPCPQSVAELWDRLSGPQSLFIWQLGRNGTLVFPAMEEGQPRDHGTQELLATSEGYEWALSHLQVIFTCSLSWLHNWEVESVDGSSQLWAINWGVWRACTASASSHSTATSWTTTSSWRAAAAGGAGAASWLAWWLAWWQLVGWWSWWWQWGQLAHWCDSKWAMVVWKGESKEEEDVDRGAHQGDARPWCGAFVKAPQQNAEGAWQACGASPSRSSSSINNSIIKSQRSVQTWGLTPVAEGIAGDAHQNKPGKESRLHMGFSQLMLHMGLAHLMHAGAIGAASWSSAGLAWTTFALGVESKP